MVVAVGQRVRMTVWLLMCVAMVMEKGQRGEGKKRKRIRNGSSGGEKRLPTSISHTSYLPPDTGKK